MAKDYLGWNSLSSNKNGFMTDEFELENVSLHHTINFDSSGNIGKSHTTFNVDRYDSMKIYPDGNTSLDNTKKDSFNNEFNSDDNNSGDGFGGGFNSFNGF